MKRLFVLFLILIFALVPTLSLAETAAPVSSAPELSIEPTEDELESFSLLRDEVIVQLEKLSEEELEALKAALDNLDSSDAASIDEFTAVLEELLQENQVTLSDEEIARLEADLIEMGNLLCAIAEQEATQFAALTVDLFNALLEITEEDFVELEASLDYLSEVLGTFAEEDFPIIMDSVNSFLNDVAAAAESELDELVKELESINLDDLFG